MTTRTHVVLVPGFVGFDALGQLKYYAGVTDVFERWRTKPGGERNATLHYFDNFPTASVDLRAKRLRDYLLKRVARGEFSGDDRVTLVGHSTGGLDIRRAIYDLALRDRQVVTVDMASNVHHDQLLHHLHHMVFVSVPHYGTNLADFGWAIRDTLQAVLRDAALAVQLNRDPLARLRRKLEHWSSAGASDLLNAIADALNESDEDHGGDEQRLASEREARAQLALWLEHMGKDFAVIGDLRSANGHNGASISPAHFSAAQREQEMLLWQHHGISTRSYASLVPRNGARGPNVGRWLVPALKLAAPGLNAVAQLLNKAAERWWLPAASLSATAARAVLPALAVAPTWQLLRLRPEAIFETFYALCADPGGPFRVDGASMVPELTDLESGERIATSKLELADSDGVVNTLSMCWPFEPAAPSRHPHFLVKADHGDIIGHYKLKPTDDPTPSGRRYDAYDIFPSGAGFDSAQFARVWSDVFDSCP